MKPFPEGIYFQIQDLLKAVSASKGVHIPAPGGEDEINFVSNYFGGKELNELAVWIMITAGPVAGSQPLIGFGIEPASDNSHCFDAVLRLFPEWKRRNWVPVAGDGCGNYYIYPLGENLEEQRPIFFVDVMQSKIKPEYVVASHLFHFLTFLLESELGADYWPFDKEEVLKRDPNIELVRGLPLPWEI